MRFKAKLVPEQVSLLYSLLAALSRLSPSSESGVNHPDFWSRNGSIVYLDNQFLRLSCKGKTQDTEGMACFAELVTAGGIFLDHRIESAADNNAIVMEMDLGQLRMALQSIQSDQKVNSGNNKSLAPSSLASALLDQQYTILKLAKSNGIPCLCLDAFTISAASKMRIINANASTTSGTAGSGMIQVHYAVPVRIMRPSEMQQHLPPQMALPDVQVEFRPAEIPLRIVMDRIRHMMISNPTVELHATLRGELTIAMDHEGASLRTFFQHLIPRPDDCRTDRTNGHCTVKVDVKKLCAALSWQQGNSLYAVSTALLCFVENERLVLHVNLNPSQIGFFTYYIPVHYRSSDPADE